MHLLWKRTRARNFGPLTQAALLAITATCCAAFPKTVKLFSNGDSRALRHRPDGAPPNAPAHPALLVLAFDGIDRVLLYDMLNQGELPQLAALLGAHRNAFPHAYFDPSIVATLPSTTAAGWATVFTGVSPAQHGVMGNEFFIRERREFAAPIPNSVDDSAAAISVFTDGYANKLLAVPTVYERMRAADPNVLIWVSMNQFYRGADRLMLTRRAVLVEALGAILQGASPNKLTRKVWAKLDEEDIEVVVDELKDGPLPDVLTIYIVGTDDYAHVAQEGPDVARRAYMREIVEPQLASLRNRLEERGALQNRFVVVTGDHGHTEVLHDDAHALAMNDTDDPPAVVRGAGFRLRPFKVDVDANDDFQAALAYEGAMAFVYLADRSSCPEKGHSCDWKRPPRYDEDVVPAAEAFFQNNLDGSLAPGMKGTLDMVLVRRPRPFSEEGAPFEAYVGAGHSSPVDGYLRDHPHPTYVDLDVRLRDLAVGPEGARAGDVLLIAHNGDRDRPQDRYYFASPYHSWHGSPSHRDSDIPLIVAHPRWTSVSLESLVRGALGESPRQQKIGGLLLTLRAQ